MKQSLNMHERGQALVLIAFAAVGLVAFAALAIDGSIVFSDRRHAHNWDSLTQPKIKVND